MIINLIATPRNLSTALMYSFRQRRAMKVIDEPFFAHFLLHTGRQRPSRRETLQRWPQTLKEIDRWIKSAQKTHKEVFLKNMANQHIDIPLDFIMEFRNVFLLRHPGLILRSYSKVIDKPDRLDIGLHDQRRLYDELKREAEEPIVIEAEELQKQPRTYLQDLCARLQLDFQEEMLFWPKGPKPEDGPWAKYWYHGVHASMGFTPWNEKDKKVAPHLQELYEDCLEDYLYLKQYEISQDATKVQPEK